ncbi:FtsJ methyltransferase domain-containing protein 1 [Habropoda laboriosa]|uniref:Cap-specific mRNA (nucleoside-2'-O-)-methyltransferase 2 n=1 Tax=Habropoda laboriosa TaxID=597456 RepID=A0A0L7QLK5_9HYME|nr:PREDICTED: cap-specific mRNA (nucleoside-2'-O-)-methyltransferase 2 [Habropoda laboriosa]KOC59396.1 FtsJ methyltransferase domain-containing protein 1 [Habropoda laboriosa]
MEEDELGFEKKQTLFTNNDSLNYQKEIQNEHINKLFNKRFSIVNNECYLLPEPTSIFKDYLWKIDELQMLKHELNTIKNCLNNYDLGKWQLHTKLRNSAKDVMTRLKYDIQPELLTQAWCKFYEIVASFPLIPVDYIRNTSKHFTSIHLCEAPGAFITSLNHWLKTHKNAHDIQWNWIGMTLNPYYEGNSLSVMIDDDRFIRHTLNHWCFGEDNTGNVMNLKNLNELITLSELHQDIFLITADGSMDCIDVPAEQESVLIHLHFCETVSALHLLATGGSFLLKMFTIFECNSVCLIYLLSCCFNNVSVIKPATSKEGNSETYVVCTNFKGPKVISPYLEKLKEHYEHGPKQAIFCKHDIPHAFMKKIIECSEFFKSQQCLVIQNNIITFNSDNPKMLHDIRQIQRVVADKYIKNYNVKKLESGEIVGNVIMLGKTTSTNEYKKLQGSYNERCEKQYLAPLDRIKSFCNDICKIEFHLLADKFIKYKFTKLPKELQICLGKRFHTICSSKFCSKSALKIKNGVDDLLIKINHKIQFPSVESIHELEAEILHTSRHKIVVFQYTDIYDSHKMIIEIYDALQKLNNGTTLTLIGYSLFTHYSIGLLYIISCAFNSLKVTVHNDLGLKITLHHYNYNLKVLNFLNEISVASSEAQRQGKAIVEIISPLILYEGCNLCYSAEEFNHWIIKAYIHYALHTLKN